jgi:hypothetical protein
MSPPFVGANRVERQRLTTDNVPAHTRLDFPASICDIRVP